MIILPKAQWTSQPKYPPRINWAHPATAQLVRAGAATSKRDLVTNAPLTTALIEPGTSGNLISRVGTNWPFSYAAGDEWTVPTNGSLTILAAVPKTRTTTWGGIWRTGPLSNGTTLFNVATTNGFAQIRITGSDIIPATVGPQVPQGEQVYIAFRSSSGTGAEAAVFWNGEKKRTGIHTRTLGGVTINNVGGQFALTDGLGDLAAYWVWNRSLSDSELVALTQNPWQLYQPQRFIFPLQSTAANAYSLDTTPGAYNLTGSNATVLFDRLTSVTPGAYSITGSDATVLFSRVVDVTPGAYNITGSNVTLEYAAALTLEVTPGAYSITGSSATVLFDRLTSVTPGAYSLTGSDVTLATGVVLDTTPGSYSITGSAVTTYFDRAVLPTPGAYNLTGSNVTFTYAQLTNYVLDTEVGSYSITGFSPRLTYVISGVYSQPDRNTRLEAIPTKAPNLTIPRPVYDVGQQMQLVNQLRLYFVGIDGATSSLVQITNTLSTLSWMDCN